MIINIPLQIDDGFIEEKLTKDYEKKVTDVLADRIERALVDRAKDHNYWKSNPTAIDGMRYMVNDAVDKYVESHTNEIIDMAVERLEYRLKNRKAIKAVGTDMIGGNDENENE